MKNDQLKSFNMSVSITETKTTEVVVEAANLDDAMARAFEKAHSGDIYEKDWKVTQDGDTQISCLGVEEISNDVCVDVLVFAESSDGSPDVLRIYVKCTKDQYEEGVHYDVAKTFAELQGYEPKICIDDKDHAWRVMDPSALARHHLMVDEDDDFRAADERSFERQRG